MRHEAWNPLVENYAVLVPATVALEAFFYTDGDGRRHEIDLQSEASGGRIEIVEMEAGEIGSVAARFSSEFRERLDAGEMEGLAYLIASMETDLRFVSADGPAIQAVAMLDPDLRVISLEEVLDLCGFTKPLASQFTRDFVRRNVREGTTRRIQGRGMV